MTLLGKSLDASTGNTVASSNSRQRNLVAQIAKLECCVGAAVDSRLFGLGRSRLLQQRSALGPALQSDAFIQIG